MGDAFDHGRLPILGNRRTADSRADNLEPDETAVTELRIGGHARGQSSSQALTHRPRALSHNTDGLPRLGEPYADISDFHQLMDELSAIVEKLRQTPLDPGGAARPDDPIPTNKTTSAYSVARRQGFVQMARLAYAKRRKRGAIFGDPELIGEPARDILLDLYIAHSEDKPVSVSSACIGSASPPTTGLRWLSILTEQGLVERRQDPRDQRRVLVQLTERALEAMDEYFANSASLTVDRRAARG